MRYMIALAVTSVVLGAYGVTLLDLYARITGAL